MEREERKLGNMGRWIPIVGMLCILAGLLLSVVLEEGYREDANSQTNNAATVKVIFPEIDDEVLLCSQVAKQLYDNQLDIKTAIKTETPIRPLVIEYDSGNMPGTFLLSEFPDFSNATEYELPAFYKVARIENLKTGTQYYYKVTLAGQEQTGSFKTVESTRFINIQGIENVRDIGGYRNQDGKLVRQGLLIRGTEMDGLENEEYKVPESEIENIRKTFGFVYDFDLRWETMGDSSYQTPLGSNVGHKFYSAPQYEYIFREDWYETVRQIFSDLAKPENYPMYMHCTWGKDRTGTVVFLLQGILNMSEGDMMREYLLTGFLYEEMVNENLMLAVIEGLQEYEGDTLQEKIVTYLTEYVGVTQEEIASIRQIFLVD